MNLGSTECASRPCERSFVPLVEGDLRRAAKVALNELDGLFFRRQETGARYRDRLLLLCLCQGAAEHFVRPGHGVKDLDVWAFLEAHPGRPFPWRWRRTADFGCSRLGRHPHRLGFIGRPVDVLGRSIVRRDGETSAGAVRAWLHSKGRSARNLAGKPVVAIWPEELCGSIIWDPGELNSE